MVTNEIPTSFYKVLYKFTDERLEPEVKETVKERKVVLLFTQVRQRMTLRGVSPESRWPMKRTHCRR